MREIQKRMQQDGEACGPMNLVLGLLSEEA